MDIEKIIKDLTGFKFFAGLNELEINKVIKYSTYHEIRKGKILFYQGDKADIAYFVVSGKVKKVKYKADETSAVIGKSINGEWIGLSEVLLCGPYLFDAILEEESKILYISSVNLQSLMKIYGFQEGVIKSQAKDYYQIHSELESRSPYERIINFLLARLKSFKQKDKKSGNFTVEITQEALADSIGFTRETVNKYLHELQQKDIINISRGKIEIIKLEELEK